MIILTSFVSLLVFSHAAVAVGGFARGHGPKNSGPQDGVTFAPISVLEGWAQYSPVYPVKKYRNPPRGCDITQVNIVSFINTFGRLMDIGPGSFLPCQLKRHGARFPTSSAGASLLSAVNKLKSATSYTQANLQFLKNYTYSLGTESLVPLGALQSFIAGESTYIRYHHLINRDNIPFVRASGSKRVVDSATNWTAGFSLATKCQFNPVLSVIMSEDLGANNTLDDSGCPLKGSSDVQDIWIKAYAQPIADRLNSQALGMNVNLSASNINNLILLCPFDSVVVQTLGPFCHIFKPQDFANFEWGMVISKYYGTGYGQKVGGRIQGVGYVNELLARLTNSPVKDETQTNRTLTSNPATFPLNRVMYADFSHDNQMVAIFSAIGLLNETHEILSDTKRNPITQWDMSDIVPFSSEMAVERLSCTQSPAHGYKAREYVRILINDALQPLSFCGGKDGLCSKFVESQSYARNNGEGDFHKCFPPE